MRLPPLNAGLRRFAPIAFFLLLATACTEEREPELPAPDVIVGSETEGPVAPPTDGAAGVPTDVGRLAVLDERGSLLTFAPDGTDAVVLAEAVQGESLFRQPTWSPDGSRLAWVRIDVSEGTASASLVTATADGSEPIETPTDAAPFYLSWDPTASRIAYLSSPAPPDIELGIMEVAEGGQEPTPLSTGSPFYLSWDPSGERMLVHVGGDRLERLEIDGTLTTVDARPGLFNAPVWSADGKSLFYVSAKGGRQQLVVHDLKKARGRRLVQYDGAIRFVVSPDGNHVAFQVNETPDDVGPLSVLDRRTGKIERVATGPIPAFFWNPVGDRLLFLLPEAAADRVWFHWGVWDGTSTFTTPRFLPTDEFGRDYLQFFEQYAQSMSLWAPDGSAFTYAGTSETGMQGIWVQPARSGAEPILVAEGVFAAWSPG
jgi:dipeptidyl aminopeptidase/acylaminoacyl peptidase